MKYKLWIPMFGVYLLTGILFCAVTFLFFKRGILSPEIVRPVWLLTGILYLISFAVVIIAELVYFHMIRSIVRAGLSYARGDYSLMIRSDREDALGQIADTMNFMAQELDSLEEDQRKFISNVSHDFRSPLTSIKGYAQAMADGVIPEEMMEKYLGIIIFEAERLEKLTDNLLELNSYGAKGSFLEIADFSLHPLIDRTLQSFEGRFSEKNIRVTTEYAPGDPQVRADASKIDQVLHNLIDNAIKFSDLDSSIEIGTVLRGTKVFVSIRDHGIGIPRENQTKIWERFYKTDSSRGADKRGTGLGLSIVREIIHAHKENINVISTEGVGTEFIFSLPRVS